MQLFATLPVSGTLFLETNGSIGIGGNGRVKVDSSILRVFVSSTSEDLKVHRAVARLVIANLRWHAVMMEDFGANAAATVSACHEELEKCQLMLLIVAFRQGWVPTIEQGGDGTDSITALELAFARERKIPVLAILANDDTWPLKLCDDGPKLAWIKQFRSSLNLPAEFFGYEDTSGADESRLPAFREKVRTTLLTYKERLLAEKAQTASQSQGLDRFPNARDTVLYGTCVPFIGSGIYNDGPLSVRELARTLSGKEADEKEEVCLATVAEYCERLAGSREIFLRKLKQIVANQARDAGFPSALDMLLHMERPPLLVVTTYDQLIEEALAKAGRRFVVVAHVIRSVDASHDGKIVVLRPDASPVFCPADKVEIAPDELVIYRPLGSPLLHDRLDPSLEVDTVVITESDHLTFLERLDNPNMQVPTRFSRPLQAKPLLFLGYGLDVWHYRLVVHAFRSVGGRMREAQAFAVREPASSMEEMEWQRLGAHIVPLDCNDFARRVMTPAAAGGA